MTSEREAHSASTEFADAVDDRSLTAETPGWLLSGNSGVMRTLRSEIARIATLQATVLITGERGTRKELMAAELHRRSGRSGAYVGIDCATMTEGLFRTALAGAERESVAHPARRAVSPFHRASGGTLFLGEIAELSLPLQARLIDVLDAPARSRGGSEARSGVRIIAATSHEPQQAVQEGMLREDLYYFLSGLTLRVPSLRARGGDDVVLLARALLDELNASNGTRRRLDEEATRSLLTRAWPGNVRELQHVIERSYALAEGFDAPLRISSKPAPLSDDRTLRAGMSIATMERRLIELTLEHFRGDKRRSATALGISIRTLYNRLNQYRSSAAGE